MKNLKENKGITLLALIVTIIVLLILSGISIAMLVGDNGIINNGIIAKRTTNEATAKEKVGLAIMAAKITGRGDLELEDLLEELEKEGITVEGTPTSFPIKVSLGNFQYIIDEKGNIKEIEGIVLSESEVKLVQGETKTLEATLATGITGTVNWTSSDESIVTVNSGIIEGIAGTGTATITASIIDQATTKTYKSTCTVTAAQAVTAISVNDLTISNGGTGDLVVTITPNTGTVEDVTYESSDTSVATVDENGTVTGEATGTATITVKGSYSTNVSGTCTVTVEPARVSVTAAQIAADPESYYGQEVKNYTAGGKIYRIFYVDTAGDFGDENTIYLKADWTANDVNLNSVGASTYTPVSTDILEAMNPDWWSNRSAASWNPNEKCASYLCDPTTIDSSSNQAWASYFDGSKANYVIGSPSVEMFVKSYNQVSHTVGNYTLGASYRATSYPGYIYTLNGAQSTMSNSDYYTGTDTLDYSGYNSMYCGKNGAKGSYYTWLASPSSSNDNYVCAVNGSRALLNRTDYGGTYGVSPLVSLKSGVLPEIEM